MFLERAFVILPVQDYRAYLAAEQQERGKEFDLRLASAAFLERLATTIAERDLDDGFLMRETWHQFRNTDPPESWPANRR